MILAIPAPRLARLVAEIAPRSLRRREPDRERVVGGGGARCAGRHAVSAVAPGVLVASGEPLRAKAITLSSRKWGARGDAQLLRLSFGRFGDDLAVRASDDELLAWAMDDLVAVFGLAVDPVDVRVRRWIDAMPQYGPGHADLVAEVRAGLPPTLAVAGSYLDGIGVPACVGAAAGRTASSRRWKEKWHDRCHGHASTMTP